MTWIFRLAHGKCRSIRRTKRVVSTGRAYQGILTYRCINETVNQTKTRSRSPLRIKAKRSRRTPNNDEELGGGFSEKRGSKGKTEGGDARKFDGRKSGGIRDRLGIALSDMFFRWLFSQRRHPIPDALRPPPDILRDSIPSMLTGQMPFESLGVFPLRAPMPFSTARSATGRAADTEFALARSGAIDDMP